MDSVPAQRAVSVPNKYAAGTYRNFSGLLSSLCNIHSNRTCLVYLVHGHSCRLDRGVDGALGGLFPPPGLFLLLAVRYYTSCPLVPSGCRIRWLGGALWPGYRWGEPSSTGRYSQSNDSVSLARPGTHEQRPATTILGRLGDLPCSPCQGAATGPSNSQEHAPSMPCSNCATKTAALCACRHRTD